MRSEPDQGVDHLVPDRVLQVVVSHYVVEDDALSEPGASKLHSPVVPHVPAGGVGEPLDLVERNVLRDLLAFLLEAELHLPIPAPRLCGHLDRPEILEEVAVVPVVELRVQLEQLLLEKLSPDQVVGNVLGHYEGGDAEPREPEEDCRQRKAEASSRCPQH